MNEHTSIILLLIVTLVGGAVAYSLLSQYGNVGYCALTVGNAEATVSTDGGVALAVSFENAGNKLIREASLEVDGRVLANVSLIEPRRGASFLVENPPGAWIVGAKKTGVIKAVYADGSMASAIVAIQVVGSPSGSSGSSSDQSVQNQKQVLISDGFDSGLSGWTLWGDEDNFNIEVDSHGKPSPSLHVYGNGPQGALAGAAKTVELPPGATTLSLSLIFDYNVHALPSRGSFPGNLWLRVDAGGAVLYNEKVYEANSADSGWKNVEAQIVLPSPAPNQITLTIYMVDQSNRLQEFWVDNVFLDC